MPHRQSNVCLTIARKGGIIYKSSSKSEKIKRPNVGPDIVHNIFKSLKDIEIPLCKRKTNGFGARDRQWWNDQEMVSECHNNPGKEIAPEYKATTREVLNLSEAHHLMITEQCGSSGRRFCTYYRHDLNSSCAHVTALRPTHALKIEVF